jgi:hypothetical protein
MTMAQPPSMSTGESHWLLSAAGKWTEEDEKQWKRQQHRENMVHFRRKKKAQQAQLRAQHRQLELQLQQHLAGQRRALARASGARAAVAVGAGAGARTEAVDKLEGDLRGLVLEREDLRRENLALRERITQHERVHSLIAHEAHAIATGADVSSGASKPSRSGVRANSVDDRDGSNSDSSASAGSSYTSSMASSSPALGPSAASPSHLDPTVAAQGGFRVFFDSGAPSFHYHPLSKQQCNAIKLQYDVMFAARPIGEEVGTMLGWRVERAPLERKPELGNALLARAWYTKRVRCTSGSVRAAVDKLAVDTWPTVTEPALWSKIHTYQVTSRLLQIVDQDTYVLVRNVPDPSTGVKHVRYLNLVQRSTETNAFNQRVTTYSMVVATSPANSRSQDAEREDGVMWVRFGGAIMSLVEVDHETFDIVYDHCSCVLSERHAQQQLVDWSTIAVRWEQIVIPTRMLCL